MQINVGKYVPRDTIIHRLDPRLKIVFNIVFAILFFVISHIITLLFLLSFTLVFFYITTKRWIDIIKLLKLPILLFLFMLIIYGFLITEQNANDIIDSPNAQKIGFSLLGLNTEEISNINIEIKEGEILGIAGVEGNGQEEIELVISGILKPKEGKIEILDNSGQLVDITNFSVKNKNKAGISHIPGDRHKYAIVLDFTIRENAIIRELYNPKFQKLSFIKNKVLKSFYKEIQEKFDVRGDWNGNALARSLSGGNQQKAVVGREILSEHKLLVVVQPTRGLDVGAINQIYDYLLEEKKKKKCILLISYELDEVFALADSIMVINKGKLSEKRSAKSMTREQIGILMGGVHND